MFDTDAAKTAALTGEEHEALALVEGKWPFGNLVPVLVVRLIIALWRPSWSKVTFDVMPVYGHNGEFDHEGEGRFLAGGREFVNVRLKKLLGKCVLSPGSSNPIVDEDGGVLLTVRAVDRDGNASPRPKTHPAWYCTHKQPMGHWVSWKWLAERGLVTKAPWPLKKGRTVRYQACLLDQSELDELRSILIVSEVAEEVGVIKQRGMTVRRDGSLEIGILPHGPVTADGRDLYQEVHDKEADDTRTRIKAILEQARNDTLPWMQDSYDGVPNESDLETVRGHEGYEGVVPLDPPTREDNKEMRRPRYRLGDNIRLGKLDGTDVVLMREENVLWSRKTQQYFTPKDEPTRYQSVRELKSFKPEGERTVRYMTYGSVHKADVVERYGSGLIKRIDPSIRAEINGMIRGLVESGNFRFALRRRTDAHASTRVHRCRDTRCPQEQHWFNDKGYAHVCGSSGSEYWMVKALVIMDRDYFPFLDLPKGCDVLVTEIYGGMVGDLMRLAPEAFTRKVLARDVMFEAYPVRKTTEQEEVVKDEESLSIQARPDPRTVWIINSQKKEDVRGRLIHRYGYKRSFDKLGVCRS